MIESGDIELSRWTPDQNANLIQHDTSNVQLSGAPCFPQRSYNLRVNRGETQFSIMVGGTRPITIEVKHALGLPPLRAITLGHGYAGFIVKIRITNSHINTCHLWYVATGPGQQQAILHQMLTVGECCSII